MNFNKAKLSFLLGSLLLSTFGLIGCGSKTDEETKAPAQTTPAKKKPGGMADSSIDPAPPGVKTGVEGGKK